MLKLPYEGYAKTGIRKTFVRWSAKAEAELADMDCLNGGSVRLTMHDHKVTKQKGAGDGPAVALVRPSMTLSIPRPELGVTSVVQIKGADWHDMAQIRASVESAAANRLQNDEIVSQLPRDCVSCVHKASRYVPAADAVYVAEELGLDLDEEKVHRAGKRLSRIESRPLGADPHEAWATFVS